MPETAELKEYFKAQTHEYNVNVKNRFTRHGIVCTEDPLESSRHNRVFHLEVPQGLRLPPGPGWKSLVLTKYYLDDTSEMVTDTNASIFYTSHYPRYKHVAQIIKKGHRLRHWNLLREQERADFVVTWGKVISKLAQSNRNNVPYTPYKLVQQNYANPDLPRDVQLLYDAPKLDKGLKDVPQLYMQPAERFVFQISVDSTKNQWIREHLISVDPHVYIDKYKVLSTPPTPE